MAIMYKLGTSPSYASAYSHLILPKKEKEKEETVSTHALLFFFCPSAVGRADAFVQFFCFSNLFAAAAELGGYISHLPNFFWLLLAILSPLAHPSSDSSVAIC